MDVEIKADADDIFLSLKDPTYKDVMHAEFKKLGPVRSEKDRIVADDVLERFVKRGKRFFKPQSRKEGDYAEVDKEAAAASEW